MYTKSRHEKKVYEKLIELDFQSFLPMFETIRQWKDRKKKILKILFPSYVFVKINYSLEFHKALSINGACGYIRFGKDYAFVSEKEINQIKLLIGDKNISDIETNVELPKMGEFRKIISGPLNGLDCEIIKADSYNKITVRIDSLKQNIMATIPFYYLTTEIVSK